MHDSLVASRPAPEVGVSEYLPEPPDDNEKFWYMGRQHRWLPWVQAISFALIAISVFRFATTDLRLLLFLIPMSLYTLTLVVSLASSTRSKRTSLGDHLTRVAAYAPADFPSVDVFLPTAGEPLAVLDNTYRHVAAMTWPGELRVLVLDDAARDDVAQLAEHYGFDYSVRPDRGRLKKAGNLGHGYRMSNGDFIAVFDADFVPRPDYLHNLIPYFDEAEVGIVQSPQFFDTGRNLGWLQRCAGATQELFYRWIQPARDRSRAAICVGTCAVYRRAALEQSGGFAQIGHSEDVHTGVNLMRVGFHVRYVPIIVSKGICPDTLSGFLNQQYRWCTGSMSLLADKSFHDEPHISFRQRLCFWAGFLYYISTSVNALLALGPALAMVYVLPQWVLPQNSLWLTGAVLLWTVILPLTFKSRWRIEVLRVQLLYSYAHAVAIFHILTGRTKEWVATGAANKGSTPLAVQIGRFAKFWITLTQVALWVGLIHGVLTFGLQQYWAMLVLNLVTAYIQLPILFSRISVPGARKVKAPASVPRQRGARTAPSDASLSVVPMPRPRGLRSFRPDIQGMRAIAVLMVVLYHAWVPIDGGFVGVDVFFVISGFLITGHLVRQAERRDLSLRRFYLQRVRRLLPTAVVVTLATLVVARVWGSVFQFRAIAHDAIAATFYFMNYRLAASGIQYSNSDVVESPLKHYWSLAVEEQFYIVWPAVVLLVAVVAHRWLRPILSGVVLLVIVGSLASAEHLLSTNGPMGYYGIQSRAWELAAGALVALFAQQISRMSEAIAGVMSWSGLGLIVWAAFAYDGSTRFPGLSATVPVLGAMLIIAGGCAQSRWGAEVVLRLPLLQGLGRVSYAWYLWHWPVLILGPVLAGHELSSWQMLSLAFVALWLSILSYWMIERETLRGALKKIRWAVAGVSLSSAVAALSVVLLVTLPSFAGRGEAVASVDLRSADLSAQLEAVDHATAMREVPSNLTPEVLNAAVDMPVSSEDGCHADYLVVEQPGCAYGDPAGQRVLVLFGDSHAQQWLPALDEEGKANGWKVIAWTKAACPVAEIDVYADLLGRQYTECLAWRDATKRKILQVAPDLLLVGQSDMVLRDVSNVDWSAATTKTLAEFQDAGVETSYLLDTPFMGVDVPRCVASNLRDAASCSVSRESVTPLADRRGQLDRDLRSAGFRTLDTASWFCTEELCPAVVGNMLVYRDESHMTATYSRYLAPLTASIFESSGASAN